MKLTRLLFLAGLLVGFFVSGFAQVTIPWTDVDKTGSNLTDIATRNFSDLQAKPTTLAGYGISTLGDATANSITFTNGGAITDGGTGALNFTAGGSNQPVTFTPSGTGNAVINLGSVSIPTPRFQGLQVAAGTDVRATIELDTVGTQGPTFMGRRARGVAGTPSAALSGDTLAQYTAEGFGATVYTANRAGLSIFAAENRTDSAAGTSWGLSSSLLQTITNYEVIRGDGVGRLLIGVTGNKTTAAWGTLGAVIAVANAAGGAFTVTDNTSSGTVATAVANSFSAPTFAASSATTFTNAANLYIAGDVAAGTNVTLTNSYGLWNVGKTRLDGSVFITGNSQVTGSFSATQGFYTSGAGTFPTTIFAGLEVSGSQGYLTAYNQPGAVYVQMNYRALTHAFTQGSIAQAVTTDATIAGAGSINSLGGIYAAKKIISGTTVLDGTTANATLTGGAGNMTITAGTGASRTLTLQTTTSGSAATNALVLDAAQGATFTGIMVMSTDTLSGAGAVSITKDTTKLTSSGVAQALTLANGVDGQIKHILHDVDGGSMVLTPTTKTGFSTVTFTNAGDTVTLEYATTRGWFVIGSYGAVIAP